MKPVFSDSQLSVLIRMQDQLNKRTIGDDWVNGKQDFLLAAGIEAAEAIDHHGWKWWKANTPDMDQLRMELVDILHFVLSDAIRCELTDELYREFPTLASHKNLLFTLKRLAGECFNDMDLNQVVYFLYAAFKAAGMSSDEIFKLYVGKNVLNAFRQNNGYKEGTYIKVWSGKEDNEYLTQILETADIQSPTIDDDVYRALTAAYEIYA